MRNERDRVMRGSITAGAEQSPTRSRQVSEIQAGYVGSGAALGQEGGMRSGGTS